MATISFLLYLKAFSETMSSKVSSFPCLQLIYDNLDTLSHSPTLRMFAPRLYLIWFPQFSLSFTERQNNQCGDSKEVRSYTSICFT